MKICLHCGAKNNDSDRYCDWCGSILPEGKRETKGDGSEHDFTTGVMRYAPDADDPDQRELPVYLTRQAADRLQPASGDAQGQEAIRAVPAPLQNAAAQPQQSAVPKAAEKRANKNGIAVAVLLTTIGVLLGLILIGILVLLRG